MRTTAVLSLMMLAITTGCGDYKREEAACFRALRLEDECVTDDTKDLGDDEGIREDCEDVAMYIDEDELKEIEDCNADIDAYETDVLGDNCVFIALDHLACTVLVNDAVED